VRDTVTGRTGLGVRSGAAGARDGDLDDVHAPGAGGEQLAHTLDAEPVRDHQVPPHPAADLTTGSANVCQSHFNMAIDIHPSITFKVDLQ
jgi:hypothetical protein